ncbi:MAG: hypothetical protein PHW62_00460 [Candidatus Ratteibacteria bacterium]|nr:hypothetical protein [Candidatus Ratteibacteria bacterium]
MRNQQKYDEKQRPLNPNEKRILAEVEQKSGLKIQAKVVRYRRHTPRATLCIVFCAPWWSPLWTDFILGVTIRNKNDIENPVIGQEKAFRRALEDYVERKGCK